MIQTLKPIVAIFIALCMSVLTDNFTAWGQTIPENQKSDNSSSQLIKQTVDGYFFNGAMKDNIKKTSLYLEDDYVVGYYDNKFNRLNRKHKIHKNPSADSQKVGSDIQSDMYTHTYLDFDAVKSYFSPQRPRKALVSFSKGELESSHVTYNF